jgi:hypothetical protein
VLFQKSVYKCGDFNNKVEERNRKRKRKRKEREGSKKGAIGWLQAEARSVVVVVVVNNVHRDASRLLRCKGKGGGNLLRTPPFSSFDSHSFPHLIFFFFLFTS